MNQHILYQSYGSADLLNECKFALLRLSRVLGANTPPIIIYTDQPDEFIRFSDILPITTRKIDAKQISDWKGRHQFVHRVKIEVIRDCLQSRPGKLLYMDSDTCVTGPLTPVFNSIDKFNVLFHENEGKIADGRNLHFRKWKKFLDNNSVRELQAFPPQTTDMWNAGVIGLDITHLPLLTEVLSLTDTIYPLFSKHTAEQFSFCYTFRKHNINMKGTAHTIFHYWNLKEFRILLERFFRNNAALPLTELAALTTQIMPQKIVQEKQQFRQRSFLGKMIQKAKGTEWTINKYYS